jgi:photosystem II stability/assembly factor-like uncharacterized protein
MHTQVRHRVRDMFVATNTGLYHGHIDGPAAELSAVGLDGQGTVLGVAIDVRDANIVYAATRCGGFFRSDDHGRTWHEKNDGLRYKEAWAIAQHPVTGTLYLGTEPAAIFSSNDRGDHWTFCEGIHDLPESIEWTFPHPPHLAHVKGIGLSPADPNVIFAAIEEGYFVRSTNGGKTWMTLKSDVWIDSHTITVMPDNPNVIVGATGHGIFRSVDGGDTFVHCTDGVGQRYCYGIVVHPDAPATLFTAGADGGPGSWRRRGPAEGARSKFFRSADQGITWTTLRGGLPELLTAAPRAAAGCPDRAGTYLVGMNDGTIFMSSDFGDSFSQIAGGLPPVYSIAIAP